MKSLHQLRIHTGNRKWTPPENHIITSYLKSSLNCSCCGNRCQNTNKVKVMFYFCVNCAVNTTVPSQSRYRIIIQRAANGGQECPDTLYEERECEALLLCPTYRWINCSHTSGVPIYHLERYNVCGPACFISLLWSQNKFCKCSQQFRIACMKYINMLYALFCKLKILSTKYTHCHTL